MSVKRITKDGSILGHRWEMAGWKAPYTYLGVTKKTYQACPGAPIQPGSTCDYCGTGIMYLFHVQDSKGVRFKVGCDCIEYLNDTRLTLLVESDMRKLQKEQRRKKLEEEIKILEDQYNSHRLFFVNYPHPHPYFAKIGKTLADYHDYMLKNSGATAKLKKLKQILKVL